MPKKVRQPNYTTKFGQQLSKIVKDHPILLELWKNKAEILYSSISDKAIIEFIMADWEYLANIKHKSVVLPYSTVLHLKLKKLTNGKTSNIS